MPHCYGSRADGNDNAAAAAADAFAAFAALALATVGAVAVGAVVAGLFLDVAAKLEAAAAVTGNLKTVFLEMAWVSEVTLSKGLGTALC